MFICSSAWPPSGDDNVPSTHPHPRLDTTPCCSLKTFGCFSVVLCTSDIVVSKLHAVLEVNHTSTEWKFLCRILLSSISANLLSYSLWKTFINGWHNSSRQLVKMLNKIILNIDPWNTSLGKDLPTNLYFNILTSAFVYSPSATFHSTR